MPVVRVIRRDARQAPAPTPTPTPTPVSDPLEVVSVAQMRQQLRLGASTGANDPHDPIVTAAIRAGVAFVARNTLIPLLDESQVCQVEPTSDKAFLELPITYVKSVNAIMFWGVAQGYREAPAGVISVSTLGRIVYQKKATYIYPPATGWPTRRTGSPLLVTIIRGVTITEDDVLFQAVVVYGREYFNGYRELPQNHAVFALMQAAAP